MNILLLSSGTRNKIVQYFKNALKDGKVVCADMSNLAPSIYEADQYYIVPRITTPGYIDRILDICNKEHIDGVLSLIDPELSLLAKNSERFEAIGTKVLGSSYELCELSLNKYNMFKWLQGHGYNCAKSYIDFDSFYRDFINGDIKFPVFVKPILGSASLSIMKVYDEKQLRAIMDANEGLMIQEFLSGTEIGADVYIDYISNEVVSIFTKEKIVMRAGETDKAVSFKDDKLFDLVKQFVMEAGYKGQIDIDIFQIGDEYYISEVNPRFGGGYPHAYSCGIDHMKMIKNNLENKANVCEIGHYDERVYMMKYNEIMIYKEENV